MNPSQRVVVITGFPTSLLARRVTRAVLGKDPNVEVRCVVQQRFAERAEELKKVLAPKERARLTLLTGDAAAMDLGLAGKEWNALAADVDVIHHCAAVSYSGVHRSVAEQTNIKGAREVLELAEAADHLERLVHWSTALVSGARRGYVLEEELKAPMGFRNPIEETRFRAERIIREAMDELPITVLRPSIIVGDSTTGEIDRMDGPYLLVMLMLSAPPDLRIPIPGKGDVPLNLVPIDYVVEAGGLIVSDPRSRGRTFHLVDPDPVTSGEVFAQIARATGRPEPRRHVPQNLTAALLRAPGLKRVAQVPKAFLEQISTEVVWDDRNARELLAETGLVCPRFESYVNVMVDYVRVQQAARRRQAAEAAFSDYNSV